MHADVLADDELHSRQPNSVVGQHGGPKGKLRVAEVHHDLRARTMERVGIKAGDAERDIAVIDLSGLAAGTGHRDQPSVLELSGGIVGADNSRYPELAGDDGGMARPPTAIRDDRSGSLHYRFPVGARRRRDQNFSRPEPAQITCSRNEARTTRGNPLTDGTAADQNFTTTLKTKGLERSGRFAEATVSGRAWIM